MRDCAAPARLLWQRVCVLDDLDVAGVDRMDLELGRLSSSSGSGSGSGSGVTHSPLGCRSSSATSSEPRGFDPAAHAASLPATRRSERDRLGPDRLV
jgi:hypothetical protein